MLIERIETIGLVHVASDDHSRVGFVQMYADETKLSAVAFLKAAVAHYAALGVRIKRLITDNGSAYRSRLFARTCRALGITHTFTRRWRPQTNGKAERFIQTCLREWAYGRVWANSAERTAWLPAFLRYYNTRRPHSALGNKPPASRLCGNSVLQLDTSSSPVSCASVSAVLPSLSAALTCAPASSRILAVSAFPRGMSVVLPSSFAYLSISPPLASMSAVQPLLLAALTV